jgi:5,10-methylenetetrahydromethanopterin reductase
MSVPVSFGLRVPPCRPATEVGQLVRTAEHAGFDIAWLPDSQFLWRDVWATLAVSAVMTERIRLGTCVTNFETRHPSVTAAASATLAELAAGRTILGVGTGDSSIKTLGLPPTRLDRMREQIGVVRELLTGDEVEFGGRKMRLKAGSAASVPVYMAANGPKAMSLAGEVCDGAIIVTGLQPGLIRNSLKRLSDGAARGARSLAQLDVCFGTFCHVTPDPREAARIVKPYIVAMAQPGGADSLRRIGIEIDPPGVVAGIYPDLSHAEDWDAAADAAEEWVTDEMALRYADAFCLIGSPERCIERLETAVAAGAKSFYIRHFGSYTLPEELLRVFGRTIIPHFSCAGRM